ncbi:MAG: MFS transporter [Hirschia sp.]|nr:MFS transporter [Hirschia sp.]MBF16792.1 MFS transporter [Hirschia sp.]|tara:strand:+ start:5667 stop:6977 length:1311 start_codon:yes stop_codon:yes gene_type:complete
MQKTPQDIIDEGRLGKWQIAALAVTVLLNALDGFDVMSISFAAPGIAKEWAVPRDVLGWVLSMELIGMAVGSIFLGGMADRFGRRPTILGCLSVMAIGMLLAPMCSDVMQLSACRLVTGLGIGGMLAALNATVAEFSNARYRNLILPLMVIGYPLGAFLGGMLASNWLSGGNWRDVFYLGAGLTIASIPLAYWLVPETPGWLNERRPKNALKRINITLNKFNLGELDELPDPPAQKPKASLVEILQPPLLGRTILLTLAYLTHVTAYYYFVKWIPKLVVDMGFEPSAGGQVLTWAMLGGAIGGGLLGVVSLKIGVRKATLISLGGAFVMLNVFGHASPDIARLAWIAGVTAFFSNAAAVGFYALLAMAFPPRVRATGTGFGIGFGRAGAAMGPALAGILFARGMNVGDVSMIISIGSALSIIAILLVRMPSKAKPG